MADRFPPQPHRSPAGPRFGEVGLRCRFSTTIPDNVAEEEVPLTRCHSSLSPTPLLPNPSCWTRVRTPTSALPTPGHPGPGNRQPPLSPRPQRGGVSDRSHQRPNPAQSPRPGRSLKPRRPHRAGYRTPARVPLRRCGPRLASAWSPPHNSGTK